MPEVLTADDLTAVQATLENFAYCARLFSDARDEGRIQIADDLMPALLRVVAQHFAKAAAMPIGRRVRRLSALADKHVIEQCQSLIESATHTTRPIHGESVAAWVECKGV